MIKVLFTKLFLALSLVLCVMLPAAPVLAGTNPYGYVNCSGEASKSAVCSASGGDPINGSNGVLHSVTRLIATVAGSVAVIVMIVAGIRYITSNGDAEQVARAKRTLIFAAIGLVVIILGQAIINLVLSKV